MLTVIFITIIKHKTRTLAYAKSESDENSQRKLDSKNYPQSCCFECWLITDRTALNHVIG